VDDLTEKPLDVALRHTNREQQALLTGGVLGKRAVPLGLGEPGFEVRRCQDRYSPTAGRGSLLHLMDEVLSGLKVPGLHECRVACLLQFPGDPLSPRLVSRPVADEEVLLATVGVHAFPRSPRVLQYG
jgi:hypothetical protein